MKNDLQWLQETYGVTEDEARRLVAGMESSPEFHRAKVRMVERGRRAGEFVDRVIVNTYGMAEFQNDESRTWIGHRYEPNK